MVKVNVGALAAPVAGSTVNTNLFASAELPDDDLVAVMIFEPVTCVPAVIPLWIDTLAESGSQ